VVGVGAVGTLCGVLLRFFRATARRYTAVQGSNRSVLEAYAGPSPLPITANGRRGSDLLQAASDMLWLRHRSDRPSPHIRQLRAAKNQARSSRSCRRAISAVMPRPAARCWRRPMPYGRRRRHVAYLGKSSAFRRRERRLAPPMPRRPSVTTRPAEGHKKRPFARRDEDHSGQSPLQDAAASPYPGRL